MGSTSHIQLGRVGIFRTSGVGGYAFIFSLERRKISFLKQNDNFFSPDRFPQLRLFSENLKDKNIKIFCKKKVTFKVEKCAVW